MYDYRPTENSGNSANYNVLVKNTEKFYSLIHWIFTEWIFGAREIDASQ